MLWGKCQAGFSNSKITIHFKRFEDFPTLCVCEYTCADKASIATNGKTAVCTKGTAFPGKMNEYVWKTFLVHLWV